MTYAYINGDIKDVRNEMQYLLIILIISVGSYVIGHITGKSRGITIGKDQVLKEDLVRAKKQHHDTYYYHQQIESHMPLLEGEK